jgi:xylulokinase
MDKGEFVAGFDIGTTSTKVTVMDEKGSIVLGFKVDRPEMIAEDSYPEQDAHTWWQDFKALTQFVGNKLSLSKIKAIGLSSMCPNVLPVSADGFPLRKSMLYGIDQRAGREIRILNEYLSGFSGKNPLYTNYSSQSIFPKLLWLRENEPFVFDDTYKILTTCGYIIYRLTGCYTGDIFSLSAGTLIDMDRLKLFEDPFNEFHINTGIIPSVGWPSEVAGVISDEASLQTGLPADTPVYFGTGDAGADTITNLCINPGNVTVSLGGTTIFIQYVDKPVFSPSLFVNTGVYPGSYIVGGATGCGGLLTEWFFEKALGLSKDEGDRYIKNFGFLEYSPSNIVFLPFLGGARTPYNNPDAQAILFGLTLDSGKKELFCSILEAIAIEASLINDEINRTALVPNQICVSGGGAKNEVLLTLLSTLLEREILVCPYSYDSSTGAALLALAAWKGYRIDEVVKGIRERYRRVTPEACYHDYLFQQKERFEALYKTNLGFFRKKGR